MGLGLGLNLSAGYVPGWEPSELSSLLHWYRLGVGQTSDDGGVTAWNDQKGSNNLTGADGAANQPVLSNGAVVFNASDDHLEYSSALTLGKFSFYLRVEHSTPGDFFSTQVDSGGTDFLKMQTNNQARIKITSRHDYNLATSLSNDTKYTVGYERNSDGDIKVFVNSEEATLASGDGNEAISDLTNLVELGRPSQGLIVYEIVILNDSLDATNRALLFKYLSSK
jgi:hypothetical protein